MIKYFFTQFFTYNSYRCVNYPKQCQARIKHSKVNGEVLMRSEHNHPSNKIAYQDFLDSAFKVRRFSKRAATVSPSISFINNQEKTKEKNQNSNNDDELLNISQPLLTEIKVEKEDHKAVNIDIVDIDLDS